MEVEGKIRIYKIKFPIDDFYSRYTCNFCKKDQLMFFNDKAFFDHVDKCYEQKIQKSWWNRFKVFINKFLK